MESVRRRTGLPGRWLPILFYTIIVLGWFLDGAAEATARDRLWLVVWTIPAPLLFLWRTRRRQ
jgi:hypothetical protein